MYFHARYCAQINFLQYVCQPNPAGTGDAALISVSVSNSGGLNNVNLRLITDVAIVDIGVVQMGGIANEDIGVLY